MKKNFNPVTDVRNESVEGSRRIYRAIADLARNLDENRERAQSYAELFLPNIEAQRVKLRDFCEKLIFTDPLGHGRKGEELLWRKGYYDVVATTKRLRKNNAWSEDEAAALQSHLFAGVGQYHHMIFRLQIEFKLDLRGIVDFPLLVNDGGLTKGKTSLRIHEDGKIEWAWQTLHRSLVSLGDLNRYFLELQPQWDTGLSQRYYLQAVSLNADIGMPHNQLGTLSGSQNYNVDAAYHYMRCLCCAQSFEGAEGNLRRILEKNSKWLEHQHRWKIDDKEEEMSPAERIHLFVARFLILVDVWFFDKTFPANPHQLCQHVVDDLKQCLLYAKRFPSDAHLSPEQLDLEGLLSFESDKPDYLKDEVVFELVAMLLLCISHLKAKRSKLMPTLVNFTLAVLSELVQQVVEHIQDSVLSIPHPSTPDNYIASSSQPSQEEPTSPSTLEDACTIQTNSSSPIFPTLENDTADIKSSNAPECPSDGTLPTKVNGTHSEGQKNKKKKKKKKKMMKYLSKFRRRRPKSLGHNSSEDSDYSDAEMPYDSSFSSDEGNENISETEEHPVSSSEEDDDDDDEVEDDSDASSSSTRVESKDIIINHEPVKGLKQLENGNCSRNGTPEKMLEKGELTNGVHEEALQNGDSTGNADPDAKDPTENSKTVENGHCIGMKVHGPADPADLIELVADEGLLQVVKACADWLLSEEDTLHSCVDINPVLLSRLASLLNLINMDTAKLEKCKESAKFFKLKNIKEIFPKIPLTEDIKLKGVHLLKEAHDQVDWEFCRKSCLHAKEEALLRVFKLVEFGKFVANIDNGQIISYSESHRAFTISSAVSEAIEKEHTVDNGSGSSSGKDGGGGGKDGGGGGKEGGGRGREEVMAHMGTLWLRAQVRELETREHLQQRRRRAAALSPYVAVDSDVLTAHLALVKQLVAARRFIVLIPAVVVSALDELKREVGRAREAIRWLEAQFQRGNRFLRAQRLHERLPLPLIKYPKKKERDAWTFFQVVECCYYFSKQNGVHDLGPDTPLVTLLTSYRPPVDDSAALPSYSPLGIASSAGVNLEHIEAFHAKWKTTSKSHG